MDPRLERAASVEVDSEEAETVTGRWRPPQLLVMPRAARSRPSNVFAAMLIMFAIALSCSALAEVGWLRQNSDKCPPHLAPYQFFDTGYFEEVPVPGGKSVLHYHCAFGVLSCLNPSFVTVLRGIIVLSFMTIASGVMTFLLSVSRPQQGFWGCVRRSMFGPVLMLVLQTGILILTNLASVILHHEAENADPTQVITVTYEFGFWTVVVSLILTAFVFVMGMVHSWGELCCSCDADSSEESDAVSLHEGREAEDRRRLLGADSVLWRHYRWRRRRREGQRSRSGGQTPPPSYNETVNNLPPPPYAP